MKHINSLEKKIKDLEYEFKHESFDAENVFRVFLGATLVALIIALTPGFSRAVDELTTIKFVFTSLLTILIIIHTAFLSFSKLKKYQKKRFKFYFMEWVLLVYAITLIVCFLILYIFQVTPDLYGGSFLLAFPASMGAALMNLLKYY